MIAREEWEAQSSLSLRSIDETRIAATVGNDVILGKVREVNLGYPVYNTVVMAYLHGCFI